MSGKCVYYLAHRGVGKVVEDINNYKKRETELKNMTDISGIGCGDNLKTASKKYKISQQKKIEESKKIREKIRKEREEKKSAKNNKSKKNNISKNKNKKSKKTKSIKKQKSKKNIFQKLFSF